MQKYNHKYKKYYNGYQLLCIINVIIIIIIIIIIITVTVAAIVTVERD